MTTIQNINGLHGLPAITTPMPIVTTQELAAIDRGERAPSAEDGARWAEWGAARHGARTVVTAAQRWWGLGLALAFAVALYFAWHATLIVLLLLIAALYVITSAYKIWLVMRGEQASAHVDRFAPVNAIPDEEEPVYSVLVPLYHESAILPDLLQRLQALDYPADKLDVMLLIENDDEQTRAALSHVTLPTGFRTITVPPGGPRTKPRALNVGLARARGEYIVIYDAEDQPDPQQLRQAVAAFRNGPDNVVCYQARLDFYNPRQSALTRFFTLDYSIWYSLILQGLAQARGFIPLGGTSNHFRAYALRRLGGWDPYNVTEDGDLGVRLARAGLQAHMLDSVTSEEAVAAAWPWVRQRSRWIKGYIQTWLVHMRHPLTLWRELGPRGFLDFQALIGGSSFVLLLNPLLWALTLVYFLSRGTPFDTLIESLYPPAVYYPSLICLVFGNFIFFSLNIYACVRGGYYDLTRWMLFSPLYWLLMSAAAWVALGSLIHRPFYWAKTTHGTSAPNATRRITRTSDAPQAAALEPVTAPTVVAPYSLSIIIPAYNEARRLPDSLSRLRDALEHADIEAEVIVVDDGSQDDTRGIVREWMEHWPTLHLLEQRHLGKGGAIRAGILTANGAYIMLADADFSMPADQIMQFAPQTLGAYDIAIGVREGKGAQRLNEPWIRRLMGRVFNSIVQLALLPGYRDTQCGFKCLRAEVARDLALNQTRVGWGFDIEQLYIARLRRYRVVEAEIIWRYAPGSHIHPLTAALTMLRDILVVRWNGARAVYNPSRVAPMSDVKAPALLSYSSERRL